MQTPKIINAFFYFICISFLITGCETNVVEKKYVPDTKGIQASVDLVRFEQAFFALDTNNLATELKQLKQQYPLFADGFLRTVIGVRDSISELPLVKGYLSYPDARYTYDTVQQVFQEMATINAQLNELAVHYQYYFPDATPITKAFTYLSEYHGDRLAVLEDGFVGLPLDMALGEGYPPYTYLKIPAYDQRTCNAAHLVPKAANAIAQTLLIERNVPIGAKLIEQMVYNGKLFYLTDILLPSVPDSLKFGFSAYQMAFCEAGELTLYEHLAERELMYSNKAREISKFVTKGPFNPQLDLPGNSGSWLGYRMILSYVKQLRAQLKKSNPTLPAPKIDQQVLETLLQETDPQKFLTQYKPPK